MGTVGCLVYMVALFVGFLGGLFLKVDIYGVVKEKGQLQVLDLK